MERLDLDGRTLAYDDRGAGEAVLLLHPAFVADGMRPLQDERALAEGRRLVRYHRRGYGESGPAAPPTSVAEQAADALALLDHLGVDRAHLVGHSFGANVAIELALTAPERVRTLVLLEPLLLFALRPETAQVVADAAAAAFPLSEAGDRAGAVEAWLGPAFGPGWRDVLERALPGAFEQAVSDADTPFGVEVPSLQAWPRGPDDLRGLAVPVYTIVNEGAAWPGFRQTHDALLAWPPRAAGVVVPAASHLLQIEQPAAVADAIARFLDRYEER
jgi:pimeloyl-ACP methyl ester carboxylesterase